MPGFLPWVRPLLLAQCVDLDVRLYYAAVQYLVNRCGNVLKTSVEGSDTPPIHCAQHVQHYVNIFIQLPPGLQCDPVQMAELGQQLQLLGTIYPRMTFGTFMTVCMREYTSALPPQEATLCIDVTVWTPLTSKCVFHLI